MAMSDVPLSAVVLGEARELLSTLRRNRRFGLLLPFAASSHPPEHPLVKDVKSLRDIIRVPVATSPSPNDALATDAALVPPDALLTALEPFFDVVRSRDASGIITGVALSSLDRIAARLIALADARRALASYASVLCAIVDAAAACRFDATDPVGDEVVLARITRVVTTICASEALPLLSDASIMRGVEACLGIAGGRRRASDLLKRTADVALVDVFQALGRHVSIIVAAHKSTSTTASVVIPSVFAPTVHGPAFGYSLDSDAFQQHGPASIAVLVALVELCSRMADPSYSQSAPERSLGLQLLSALIASGGTALRSHPSLKRILLRDCARGVLRSVGQYRSSASIIAAAFTVTIELVHALEEDAAPFLLALLERVFPYYISGQDNVLPKSSSTHSGTENGSHSSPNGSPPPGASLSSLESDVRDIDSVIREIGLESLADLLSIPGLLCVVYRLADCNMKRPDVVGPLLKALGYASKTNGLRRRSKRLRASSSGTGRTAGASDYDTDEDDNNVNPKHQSESAKFGRTASLLCADSILATIDTIADRLKLETAGVARAPFMDEKALQSSELILKRKARLQTAASAFNLSDKYVKASKLLPLLREHGLAGNNADTSATVSEDLDEDVKAVVTFVRETPGLSKELIGSILGEPDNLSRRVLADYTATFEFESRPFTESLRVFLESFRLPGEAQKIDRIVQSFANRYFAQNSLKNAEKQKGEKVTESRSQPSTSTTDSSGMGVDMPKSSPDLPASGGRAQHCNGELRPVSVLKNADAAYVLSFSVVMLNTDQHNDSIRKKMTLEDFVKNCRGINDGEDLPKWFLEDVFDSIAAVEIRMSDEVGIGALTDLVWDEQLKQMGSLERVFPSTRESRIFDEHVFNLCWESAVVAANTILNEAGDANSVQKALEVFLSIARCATTYKISRATDAVVSSLCTATTLREGPLYGAVIRFGTDIKAQMASVALSGVSRQCGDWLRSDGWMALVSYLLRLHVLCILPTDLEKRIGGYGPELVTPRREVLPQSSLAPSWWPSQSESNEANAESSKPRKASRPNGFFAAILAASIGAEPEGDEDDDDDISTDGRRRGKRRATVPYYLKTHTREESEARDLARKCIAGCRIEEVIINEAKVLQSTALESLCRSIVQSANRLMETEEVSVPDNEKSEVVVCGVEDVILDWPDIAPPSPKTESSIIAGVVQKRPVPFVGEEADFATTFMLTPSWEGSLREKDERKARELVLAFCIDILCELTLQNRDRLHIPWPELHNLLVGIIAPAKQPPAVTERAVVALLRVGVRFLHREEIRGDVLRGFNLLLRLPAETAQSLSIPTAAGLFNLVKAHGSAIHSTSGWHAILSILENLAKYDSQAREIGLQTIDWILREESSPSAVSSESYPPLLHAIIAFASCSSVDVSIRALDMLQLLSQRIATMTTSLGTKTSAGDAASTADPEEIWSEYWKPLFLGFASAVRDPRGKVRNSALAVMERVIASGDSVEFLSASQWHQALTTVILPLMTQLFETHGYLQATLDAERDAQRKIFEERHASSGGRLRSRSFSIPAEHDELLLRSVAAACNRTRMRAVVLSSKTFLFHHLAIADGLDEEPFTQVWLKVLEVFRVAIESGEKAATDSKEGAKRHSDPGDLNEHVPETVKNMLLVMCDCGLLRQELGVRWNATFEIVRTFIPNAEDLIITATNGTLPAKVAASEGNGHASGPSTSSEELPATSDPQNGQPEHIRTTADEETSERRATEVAAA